MNKNTKRKNYIKKYKDVKENYQATDAFKQIKRKKFSSIDKVLQKLSKEELEKIDQSIEYIDELFKIQKDKNLITHSWDASISGFRQRFENGVLVRELDFRSTKDGAVASHYGLVDEDHLNPKLFALKGKKIHEHTTKELTTLIPDLLTLEHALKILDEYGDEHKMVIDIKDEGVALYMIELLGKGGKFEHLQKNIIAAAFSVKIIFELIDSLPNLAGYEVQGNPISQTDPLEIDQKTMHKMLKVGRSWHKLSLGPIVVYKSDAVYKKNKIEDIPTQESQPELEGLGKATVKYIFTTVPKRIVKKLKHKPNALSLGGATFIASIISLFNKEKAERYLSKKVKRIKKLGLTPMGVTWASDKLDWLGFNPEKNADILLDAGVKVIYSEDSVKIAKKMLEEERHPTLPFHKKHVHQES